MSSFLEVMVDDPVALREFLTGCEQSLTELLNLAPCRPIVAAAMTEGRYLQDLPSYIETNHTYRLQVQGNEDAVCFLLLFPGVTCGPGELLASIETGQPEDGPALAMVAAAALALARLVGREISDPELDWTKHEHITPDAFVQYLRVETSGADFDSQFAKFRAQLNLASFSHD